ncbi:hypothetical protein AB0I82_12695 [Streptomyces sp. NPDC050315]|uniref:hypothetical protein n=1 Tax=Streptomyces sp. NPDC050315 TaxID=3155039 RepID=UPI003429417F
MARTTVLFTVPLMIALRVAEGGDLRLWRLEYARSDGCHHRLIGFFSGGKLVQTIDQLV